MATLSREWLNLSQWSWVSYQMYCYGVMPRHIVPYLFSCWSLLCMKLAIWYALLNRSMTSEVNGCAVWLSIIVSWHFFARFLSACIAYLLANELTDAFLFSFLFLIELGSKVYIWGLSLFSLFCPTYQPKVSVFVYLEMRRNIEALVVKILLLLNPFFKKSYMTLKRYLFFL